MSSARVVAENEGTSALLDLALFDRLLSADAAAMMRPCCASRRWTGELVLGRPYGSMRRVLSASDDIIADLNWPDLAEALAAHPRLSDRIRTDRRSGPRRQEQSRDPNDDIADRIVQATLAYQDRFGHAFVICPAGRSAPEVLAELRRRLRNPTPTERAVVRDELRTVVRLRLIKMLH